MNKIQRNFKKQMNQIEKVLIKEEEEGRGLFTNNHFKYKFRGDGPRNKGLKNFLIIVIIIGIILFLANPGKRDFNAWAVSQVDNKSSAITENNIASFISGKRINYYFFSIYQSKKIKGHNIKILGICQFFISLPR